MHRDPDIYRFRIAPLPTNLNHPPHSISIPLDTMIPGEPIKRNALRMQNACMDDDHSINYVD